MESNRWIRGGGTLIQYFEREKPMGTKEQEIEKIHQNYLILIRNPNPTNDTVRDIAGSRLQLIKLVGEEEQRRLIGEWNKER
jgi:hypothetical protein